MHILYRVIGAVCCISFTVLPGCQFHSGQNMLFDGAWPIVYIKRTGTEAPERGVDVEAFAPGGDLYIRDLADSSSTEKNITSSLTLGKGDVRDPVASFDGSRILFSMRCSLDSAPSCAADTQWNIWEYEVVSGDLRRVIADYDVAQMGNDISPAYLPDGRIVFSSDRQQSYRDSLGYAVANAGSGQRVVNLHVMHSDGRQIEQISYGQSVDLDASIMLDGRILFARQENQLGRNEVGLYKVNPDGTGLRQLAGPHDDGLAYWRPRQLENGEIIATVAPVSGTWDAGALEYIRANSLNVSASVQKIPVFDVVSTLGRFGSASPVIDGNHDMLVTYSAYRAVAPVGLADDVTPRAKEGEAAPQFSLYLLNATNRSLRPLLQASGDESYFQAIALNPRPVPDAIFNTPRVSPGLLEGSTEPMGVIEVASVYDADRPDVMGNLVLSEAERSVSPVPQTSPRSSSDPRSSVADIALLKDPAYTRASQRAARFVRVTEALPLPKDIDPDLVGETTLPPVRLVGYAPVEPDGSVRLKVPANKSLAITVLDRYGRAYQQHRGWFQLRPGELLRCHGCHEPNGVDAINASPVTGNHPNTALRYSNGQMVTDPITGVSPVTELPGETMAQTRTRFDTAALDLSYDLSFRDVWTADNVIYVVDGSTRTPDPAIDVRQSQLPLPRPQNGWINYEQHIQPIWDRACVGCHNGSQNAADLNLTNSKGGRAYRVLSYDSLMLGEPVFDPYGYPIFDESRGELRLSYSTANVIPGSARSSYLVEKIFNENLLAVKGLPPQQTPHSNRLTDAEKKLVVEWIDMGASYLNEVLDTNGQPKQLPAGLDVNQFGVSVFPVLQSGSTRGRCAYCHLPVRNDGNKNPNFVQSSFVLIGNLEDDFRMVASMVTDVDNPANSLLLSAPSSTSSHFDNGVYYLPSNSADYSLIRNWIANSKLVP